MHSVITSINGNRTRLDIKISKCRIFIIVSVKSIFSCRQIQGRILDIQRVIGRKSIFIAFNRIDSTCDTQIIIRLDCIAIVALNRQTTRTIESQVILTVNGCIIVCIGVVSRISNAILTSFCKGDKGLIRTFYNNCCICPFHGHTIQDDLDLVLVSSFHNYLDIFAISRQDIGTSSCYCYS